MKYFADDDQLLGCCRHQVVVVQARCQSQGGLHLDRRLVSPVAFLQKNIIFWLGLVKAPVRFSARMGISLRVFQSVCKFLEANSSAMDDPILSFRRFVDYIPRGPGSKIAFFHSFCLCEVSCSHW